MDRNLLSKFSAEFLGTMVLVLTGCGSLTIAGSNEITGVGLLDISFAFSLSVIVMAYVTGHISGCHVNYIISIGMVPVRHMKIRDVIYFIAAQICGAVFGVLIFYLTVNGKSDYSIAFNGLGQNGYRDFSPGHYNLAAGFVAEIVFIFIFLLAIFRSIFSKIMVIYNGAFLRVHISRICMARHPCPPLILNQ